MNSSPLDSRAAHPFKCSRRPDKQIHSSANKSWGTGPRSCSPWLIGRADRSPFTMPVSVANTGPLPPPRPPRDSSTKSSFRSHSSSFEADDERSSTDDESMGPDQAFRDHPSQYAGEDTRLTSRKELSGWYAYGWAAEVFVICGMGKSQFKGYSVQSSAGQSWCRPTVAMPLLLQEW